MSSKYDAESRHPFADELQCGFCKETKPRNEVNVLQSGGLKDGSDDEPAHPFAHCQFVCNDCRDFMFVPIENNIAQAMSAIAGRPL